MKIVEPLVGHGKGDLVTDAQFFNPYNPTKKYRGEFLPHIEQEGVLQFVTFRLADSLPTSKLVYLEELKKKYLLTGEMAALSEEITKIDEWLASGYGKCILKYEPVQQAVDSSIRYFDGTHYELYDYVIMPNHVHLLIVPDSSVKEAMSSLKRYTTREINKIIGNKGRIWQRDHFDHMIRNYQEYNETKEYIIQNPHSIRYALRNDMGVPD